MLCHFRHECGVTCRGWDTSNNIAPAHLCWCLPHYLYCLARPLAGQCKFYRSENEADTRSRYIVTGYAVTAALEYCCGWWYIVDPVSSSPIQLRGETRTNLRIWTRWHPATSALSSACEVPVFDVKQTDCNASSMVTRNFLSIQNKSLLSTESRQTSNSQCVY